VSELGLKTAHIGHLFFLLHRSLIDVTSNTYTINSLMPRHIYKQNNISRIRTDTSLSKYIIININIYQQQIAICKVLDAHGRQAGTRTQA